MYNKFSHIYYEKDVLMQPAAQSVIKKFPSARLIEIENYKDIFNRRRQDWRLQKESPKIILAQKKSEFYYQGSNLTPDFNLENYFYNTLIMNCIYDCHYCYLQGMYPSANIVIFTNINDYFKETSKLLSEKGNIYLSISYDTDLLAFENIVPYCADWIDFTSRNKNLTVELRTKSTNYKAIARKSPQPNFILAWTVSPDVISKKYETSTPSLKARLEAANLALNDGWKVRLCIDPILTISNWQEIYSGLVSQIKENIEISNLHDLCLGTFRMNKKYYENLREMRTDSDIIHSNFETVSKQIYYPEKLRNSAIRHLKETLGEFIAEDKIFLV